MRGKPIFPKPYPQQYRITPAHAGKTFSPPSAFRNKQDHPRACGENGSNTKRQNIVNGSPPRMRGKLVKNGSIECEVRITPAHAGKTTHTGRMTVKFKDHPRACGENCQPVTASLWITGSPPRMRGKLICWALTHAASGITPAHAGKTFSSSCFFKLVQDHPRACGENTAYKSSSSYHLGSPPRMRGKPA